MRPGKAAGKAPGFGTDAARLLVSEDIAGVTITNLLISSRLPVT